MAYVLTDGGSTVVTYPYSIGLLRRDNPNVSFPASPTNAQLAEWNVYPVTATPQPSYNVISENITEANPILVGSDWTQQWVVTPATAQEITDRTTKYQNAAAAEATRLLTDSDTHVVKSVADGLRLHADFEAYRAALADPSSLTGYPASPQWPTLPSNIFDGSLDLRQTFEDNL